MPDEATAQILNPAPGEPGKPGLSVVVTNYRRADLVRRCLDSLRPALELLDEPAETIVVDDGSADDGPAALAREYPWAVFLVLPRNRGYARALKAGMELARAEWVLTLNNDTTLAPGAVTELLRVAAESPGLGAVAALMLFPERRGGAINSAGLGLDRLCLPHDRLVGLPPGAAGSEPVEVFGASGGAALLRRGMLESVGGIDDSFEAYLEDADLAWRARMAGWRCLLAPAAVVHHEHSSTTRHGSDRKYWLVGRNRVRLLAKNATAAHLLLYGPLIAAYELAYVVYAGLADRTTAPLRGRLRGLREWRAYRDRVATRRPVEMTPIEGVAGALRRRRAWLG